MTIRMTALSAVVASIVLSLPAQAQSYGDRLASFSRLYQSYVDNLSQLKLCRQGVPELADQISRAFTVFQDGNARVIEEITEKMKAEAQQSGGADAVKRFEAIRLNIIKDKEEWTRKDYEAVSVARALSFCDQFAKNVAQGKRALLPAYRSDYDIVMGKAAAR